MQTPVLSIVDQKRTLSSMKKKRKLVSKSVLSLPENAIIRPPEVSEKELSDLTNILSRSLPCARLPEVQKPKSSNEVTENEGENYEVLQSCRKKRHQLAIGVNDLTRCIKNLTIVAALFADDIKPTHLIRHLNFLCQHNSIPFLLLPEMRQVTKDALGFPCIALGFKQNSDDFKIIIEKIRSVVKTCNTEEMKLNMKTEEIYVVEPETIDTPVTKQPDVTGFKYLVRTSCKERVFVPTNSASKNFEKEEHMDYIPVASTEEDEEEKYASGISFNLSKKRLLPLNNASVSGIGVNEEEEVKKRKKEWVIDKQGLKKSFKYSSANVIKMQPNHQRQKRMKWKKNEHLKSNKKNTQ